MNQEQALKIKKSEILFLYQSTYSIPNGDPFTGEQRYDDETKKILVSDVRIKRFIRDYLDQQGEEIWVKRSADEKFTASQRMDQLIEKYSNEADLERLLKCIDARLFGAIVTVQKKSTKKGKSTKGNAETESTEISTDNKSKSFNVTGPVQFALLSSSLNKVDMRMHQNTSTFLSKEKNEQGSIGTTTVVPYSLIQIHGWINPYSALDTNLNDEDIHKMFKALWNSINNANTRSKSNQDSVLLLQVVYSDPTRKVYDLANKIKIEAEKQDEALRGREDYKINFKALKELVSSSLIESVNYFTEDPGIEAELGGGKFKKMNWS